MGMHCHTCTCPVQAERNAAIVAGIEAGRTLQSLGDEYGLTRERIRQIAARAGVFPNDLRNACRVYCAVEGCHRGIHQAKRNGLCHVHQYRADWPNPNDRPLIRDVHGTMACYLNRCRCAECVAAYRSYRTAQKSRMLSRPAPPTHGHSGYTNYACRCGVCKAAGAEMRAATCQRLTQRGKEHPELIPHGTVSAYQLWSCRCDVCRMQARKRHGASRAKRKAGAK